MKILLIILLLPISIFAKYSFNIELPKKEVYLNEPILATFTFRYPSSNKPRYINFKEPKAKDFIIKKLSQESSKSGENSIIKYKYLLIPQVAKELKFPNQILKYAILDSKTNYPQWSSLSTKESIIKSKAIPINTNISGNLTLEVNSRKKDKNIALITIKLKGIANFDDIKPFKLNISNTTIYSSKPKIKYFTKDNKLQGEFVQKITILGSNKIVIPKINFKYFNSNTKLIQVLQTKTDIINLATKKKNYFQNALYLLVGIFFGLLAPLLLKLINRVKIPLEQKIKLAPTQKALYKLLLPYGNEHNIQDIIKKLEENIYSNKKDKISKKEIIKRVKSASRV